MANFIIDPSSISPDEILADLRAWIATKPDSDAWKDFFAGSAGSTTTEMVAGLGGFLSYQAIIARREAFLRYAQNRSSLIGHAQNRGYSIYRGLNERIQITMTPVTTAALKKFDVIGSVKDMDLVLLEDVNLVSGVQLTFMCTIGLSKSESITYIGNSGPAFLRFKQPSVSEDIQVKLNGTIIDHSKRLVDASNGVFVAQSNAVGSVDLFFLNDPKYSVMTNSDVVTLQYVQVSTREFVASDVALDYDGIESAVITQRRILPESNTAISINAPLYAETQYIVRAREDYLKILRLLNPSVIDIAHRDVSPMIVAMYYIKDDLTLFTAEEKQQMIDAMVIHRNMGLEPPVFDEPVRNFITLNCTVKYKNLNPGMDLAAQAVCLAYQKILASKIDFDAIEDLIEDINGVKIARVTIGTTAYTSDKQMREGEYVHTDINSNLIYRVREFAYRSASTEPIWPTTVGERVSDGRIIWECKWFERQCDPWNPLLPLIPSRATWQPDTQYRVKQIVVPTVLGLHEYVAVDVINYSGSSEPVWTPLAGKTPEEIKGSYVYDGEILWQAVPMIGTPASWEASKHYKTGDAVVATDVEASDTEGVMFQAVGYLSKTSSTPPTFGDEVLDTFEDASIVWETVDKTVSPQKLGKNHFYLINPVVTLVSGATE